MTDISKPTDLIDRDRKWESMQRLWRRERPELVFVVGRRRIGKSFFLARFARAVGGIYYQATRRTESEQRASLSRRFGEFFGDAALSGGAVLPSWEALFEYLSEQLDDQPFLLVLDEFPYLSSAVPSLTSVIQKFWDHDWQDTRIRLVLCGSYISAMKQLEQVDQPLYGRRTARLSFEPFACRDAARFVEDWTPRDKLRLYGMVGNLPGHLALVDPAQSLAETISELMLEAGGRLVDEAQHMLDAFVPDAAVHYSIIEAIATGQRTWSAITSRVGKSGGALSRPLRWLEDMQIIERVVPITEKKPKRSKRVVYRITDPYLSFWHTLLAPLVRAGSIGLARPEDLWRESVEPRLDDHMGAIFEQICREHVSSGRNIPFRPMRVGSWWDAHGQDEVDVVAVGPDNDLFIGECKWGPVSGRHLSKLRERSRRVAAEFDNAGKIHLALFSGRGEADATVEKAAENGEVIIVRPEELSVIG
jgi:AAA+ ATPase superfamily predicted ATPase